MAVRLDIMRDMRASKGSCVNPETVAAISRGFRRGTISQSEGFEIPQITLSNTLGIDDSSHVFFLSGRKNIIVYADMVTPGQRNEVARNIDQLATQFFRQLSGDKRTQEIYCNEFYRDIGVARERFLADEPMTLGLMKKVNQVFKNRETLPSAQVASASGCCLLQ